MKFQIKYTTVRRDLVLLLFAAGLFWSQAFYAAAQGSVIPILDIRTGGLLGGVQTGKYLDAKSAFSMLKGGENYDVFDIMGQKGKLSTTVKKPDDPCDDFYYFEDEKTKDHGIAIGTGTAWKPLVRPSKAINVMDKTYLDIVSQILRAKGLPGAKPVIEQAVRVDLDGDGVEEVLLTASSYGGRIDSRVAANNYSFVLLRKIVNGQAQNIIIAEEYVKKKIDFGAPSRFDISAIADLNGDGKMEIVVFSEYYEGSGAAVYEIKGNKAVDVKELGAACGV